VSIDFKDDPHSGIVDAPSTMVTDGTQVKVLAWSRQRVGLREPPRRARSGVALNLAAVAR